jgi:FkbM family methyltransferase
MFRPPRASALSIVAREGPLTRTVSAPHAALPSKLRAIAGACRQGALTELRKHGIQVRRLPPTLIRAPEERALDLTIEHLTAWHLLDPTPEFFFVQIGAFDGSTGDPLRRLVSHYDWAGLLVEPQKAPFDSLRSLYADRPRVSVRNVAVGERDELRTFYSVIDGPPWAAQLASFDPMSILRYERPDVALRDKLVRTEVQCLTFESLLSDIDRVDLLQIDVEGFDAVLIHLFDFDRWRPSIVQFEHRHLSLVAHEAAVARLAGYGYRIGVSRFDTLGYHDRGGRPSIEQRG